MLYLVSFLVSKIEVLFAVISGPAWFIGPTAVLIIISTAFSIVVSAGLPWFLITD